MGQNDRPPDHRASQSVYKLTNHADQTPGRILAATRNTSHCHPGGPRPVCDRRGRPLAAWSNCSKQGEQTQKARV